MSNSGKTTLENSIKGDIDLELIGGTEQLTTTGKNLFDPKQLQGISGFTIEGNEITQSGYNVSTEKTLKQLCPEIIPGTYFLSTSNSEFSGLFGLTKPFYKNNATEITEEDLNRIVALVGAPNKTIKFTLQLERGDKATPYEPYTGGKPSPSPEYPQEIKSAGKWNEEKQKYEIDIILNGSNLWNEKAMIRGHITANGEIVYKEDDSNCIWTVVAPRDGKYAVRIEKESVGGLYFTRIFSDKTSEPYVRLNPGQKGVLTLKKGENKIQASSTSALRPIGNEKVMLSYGDQEPPTYEPYQEPQTLTLTSDRPITKWDKLVEQGGQYGIMYNSKHVVLNGSEEDWVKTSIDNAFYLKSFGGLPNSYEIFCDKLKNFRGAVNVIELNCILANRTNLYICIDGITDIGTLKTWLSENNLEVYYNSKESQFVPLSESEQTQLRNLHSYNGTTNIMVDSGEVPCGIKVAYKQKK